MAHSLLCFGEIAGFAGNTDFGYYFAASACFGCLRLHAGFATAGADCCRSAASWACGALAGSCGAVGRAGLGVAVGA